MEKSKCPIRGHQKIKKFLNHRQLTDFALINLGLLLTAVGISLFKTPNHFAIGGVSGLAIIIHSYFPHLSVGLFMAVINIVFIVLALVTVGREFTLKTVYAGFALSFYTWVVELIFPLAGPLTDDTLLELAFAIMLPAVGAAIVFNLGGSTGGTDILAKILNRYTPLAIGQSLFITDLLITIGAGAVFGIKTGLYCILGLIIKSTLVDVVVDSINVRKCFVIISDYHEQIERFIIEKLHRGATIHQAWGAFAHREKRVITTALSRRQAVLLRNFIRQTDPTAFITITNSSEIIGKGFRGF